MATDEGSNEKKSGGVESGSGPGGNRWIPNIQKFIFIRELSEVYLLLDHISGRWDKALPKNGIGERFDKGTLSIEEICEIGWPGEGSKVQLAKQAATLLLAKDKLNAAAKPASGATIAFTLMVVGEEDWQNRRRRQNPQADPQTDERKMARCRTPTRISLAQAAFPGLVSGATEFRQRIRHLIYFLSGFLLITCCLSWYVAAGNLILTHLDAVHVQEREIKTKVGLMATSVMSETVKSAAASSTGVIAGWVPEKKLLAASTANDDPAASPEACKRYFAQMLDRAKSAEPFQICGAFDEKMKEHDAIIENLRGWLPRMLIASDGKSALKFDNDLKHEESSRIFTQVLVSSVLPFLYGILGAGASVARGLWAKMRESLLAPRDYTLAIGQLALGAIIGGCISLFVSPVVAGTRDNVLGGFILTGSALSFVAGFGVEGVFQALESLVRRLFNNPDPTRKT